MKLASACASAGIATFAGLAMLASSGCTRTSDGSIEPIIPISMPSYSFGNVWKREQPKAPAASFPAPPESPQITKPRNKSQSRQVRAANAHVPKFNIATKPLFKPAASTEGIACKNVTSGTGRVKVVCD